MGKRFKREGGGYDGIAMKRMKKEDQWWGRCLRGKTEEGREKGVRCYGLERNKGEA